jgi:solute carrier family 9B (sodium/hydrogen exchanger), member 1/2
MSLGTSVGFAVGKVFLEVLIGLIAGIIMGFLAWFLNKIPNSTIQIYAKMWYCIACAIGFIIAGEKSTYSNSKYMASLTLGYVCGRIWGDKKPDSELATFWWIIQPLFFGTVGATLVFKLITPSQVAHSVACIIGALAVRIATTILITSFPSGKYLLKERAFIAFAWLPKATVQAALASVILISAKSAKNQKMIEYGNIIQTTAIFSILICAPIGAVLINTFGPLYLPSDNVTVF